MGVRLPGPHSTIWVFAETATAAALSLFSMLVIGRVIGPHETGIGAVAVSAFLLLDVVGAAMFPDALVQLPKAPVRLVQSALAASVLVGLAGTVVLASVAPLLAAGTNQPSLVWLLVALAPLLPISAFSGAASGTAIREQRFRLLALRVLVGQPVALGIGLLAAAGGLGAWAMVINQAVGTGIVFLLFLLSGRLPLRPALHLAHIRELWPIAGPQIGALIIALGRYRIFLLVLGFVVAGPVLAHAHFAFRMLDAVLSMVWQAVARIAMPRLSAVQRDHQALVRHYGQLAQLQALLGLPCSLGIALVADDLVASLLGPAWADTADAARIAGFVAAVSVLHGSHISLFVALGRTKLNLWIEGANLAVPLLALITFQPATPAGIAVVWGAQCLVVTPVVAWIVLRELDHSLLWLLHQVAPAVVAAVVMMASVLLVQELLAGAPHLVRLCVAAGAGAAVFGAAAWLLLGARPPAALRARHAPALAE